MLEAIEYSKVAAQRGEVPVAALIVQNNIVISKQHNLCETQKSPIAHAEILAISDATQKLNTKYLTNCDLYVTMEPCSMCAAAISYSRLRRVYYAAYDLKFGAVGSVTNFFTSKNCFHIPEVYSGIYSDIAATIITEFFSRMR